MKTFVLLSLARSALAGHCGGYNPPDYCCIIACDSSYANHPSYYGPGTTPACGTIGAKTLSEVYEEASSKGCSPLTENSCAFGPFIFNLGTCSPEVSIPSATGDPHLSLPHGGVADFRGEDKALYNFLSSKSVSLNVMTEMADFELHKEESAHHKKVHGSFLTQAHVVARTNTKKTVRVSVWASMMGPTTVIFANGTIDDEPVFKMGSHKQKVIDDVTLSTDYSTLAVTTPQFVINVTARKFRLERNVVGMHHRLDVNIDLRVPEETMAVAPHGIVGQGWDMDGKAVDGEKDNFPTSGEFTTFAMAKGAIEGVPNDYKMATAYATDFKYSRFGLDNAAPRDVNKLAASGELSQPKKALVEDATAVGSTEYEMIN